MVALIYLINGISIFLGYLMPKPSLLKDIRSIIKYIAVMGIKGGGHTFSKGKNRKVNTITRQDFELVYCDVVVPQVTSYASASL